MIVKSEEQVRALKTIGQIVARTLQLMMKSVEPGMTSLDLDEIGRAYLESQGAESAPIKCYDFPGTTCISIAHEVAHGVPSAQKKVKAGDLINIDVSACKDGYFGDTGGSMVVPPEREELKKLLDVTRQCLNAALKVAKAGELVSGIGKAIETTAAQNGYTVIQNIGSHGIGRKLHEEPQFIAGYYDPKDKRILKEGHVITIEPFISTGAIWVDEEPDGWTLVTPRHFRSAQFEHSMIITKSKPVLLTLAE